MDIQPPAKTTLSCPRHGQYEGFITKLGSREIKSECHSCKADRERADEQAKLDQRQQEKRRRVDNLVAGSALPKRFLGRTFENYRAETPQQLAALSTVKRYAECFDAVLSNGAGLVLCGKPGTGKTHLSAALANHVMRKFGRRAKFMTVLDLIRSARATMGKDSESTEDKVISRLLVPDLLILDEVGVQLGTNYELVTITDLLNKRYNDMRPTVLISNLERDELTRYVGERVMSRMTEGGGAILSFDWESYRERVASDPQLPKANVHNVNWSDPANPE